MLDQLDAELARGGPWLGGARYSALDPYALMRGRWTRAFARPARALPALGPYLRQVLAQPAVARVFARGRIEEPRV
jgi:glutathione S-transferase